MGYNIRRRFNEHSFDILDDNAKYWCGFLFADGCIEETKNSLKLILGLAERDIEHIKAFRAFMQSTNGIGKYRRILKGTMCYKTTIRFSSRYLCKRLRELGLKHNRIPCAELANNKDFWRGAIDGDGCIIVNKANGTSSHTLKLLGSHLFLAKWVEYIRTLYPNTITKVVRHGNARIHRVIICGECCRTVLRELYSDVDTVLMRKYIRAWEILNASEKLDKERRGITHSNVQSRNETNTHCEEARSV